MFVKGGLIDKTIARRGLNTAFKGALLNCRQEGEGRPTRKPDDLAIDFLISGTLGELSKEQQPAARGRAGASSQELRASFGAAKSGRLRRFLHLKFAADVCVQRDSGERCRHPSNPGLPQAPPGLSHHLFRLIKGRLFYRVRHLCVLTSTVDTGLKSVPALHLCALFQITRMWFVPQGPPESEVIWGLVQAITPCRTFISPVFFRERAVYCLTFRPERILHSN